MRYIRLSHEVVGARWDAGKGKWHLKVRRPTLDSSASSAATSEFEEFEDTADFVLAGTGALSRWQWPDIEGLDAFRKGKDKLVVHSAEWEWEGMSKDDGAVGGWEETVKGWGGKKVGVIGVVSLDFVISHEVNYERIRSKSS